MKPIKSTNSGSRQRAWRLANKEHVQEHAYNDHLNRNFGIDRAKYEEMLMAQKALCAICNQPETAIRNGKVKRLAVDHCHRTNLVRGLLCQKCNVGMGSMEDDSDLLLRAAEYLKNWAIHGSRTARGPASIPSSINGRKHRQRVSQPNQGAHNDAWQALQERAGLVLTTEDPS